VEGERQEKEKDKGAADGKGADTEMFVSLQLGC